MGVSIKVDTYADMQAVVASLPSKVGNVYYNSSAGSFVVIVVTEDWKFSVMSGANSAPASFATDYPAAIALSGTPTFVNVTSDGFFFS